MCRPGVSLRWQGFPGTHGPLRVAAAEVLSFISLLLIVSCGSADNSWDPVRDLSVPSAVEHYEDALRRATEWHGDAHLIVIMVGVASASGQPLTPAELGYLFQSPREQRSFLSLRLTGDRWTSEVLKPTSAATRPEIARQDWVLDSVDAWSIALANGGEEFLMQHQDPAPQIDVTLTYRPVGDEDLLVWSVHFSILFGPSLLLHIQPVTGEILEVKGR
jgi:hypothetical protein